MGVYKYTFCSQIVANCTNCDEIVIKKSKTPFTCDNCNQSLKDGIKKAIDY